MYTISKGKENFMVVKRPKVAIRVPLTTVTALHNPNETCAGTKIHKHSLEVT